MSNPLTLAEVRLRWERKACGVYVDDPPLAIEDVGLLEDTIEWLADIGELLLYRVWRNCDKCPEFSRCTETAEPCMFKAAELSRWLQNEATHE